MMDLHTMAREMDGNMKDFRVLRAYVDLTHVSRYK